MSEHALCPKCDNLASLDSWEESGDYSSCPSCGAWSLTVDVNEFEVWTCYNCHSLVIEDSDECDMCGLSKDASDYLTAE